MRCCIELVKNILVNLLFKDAEEIQIGFKEASACSKVKK
jgi:hypothetical protein